MTAPTYSFPGAILNLLAEASAAGLRTPAPGSLLTDLDRSELLSLAAAALAEVAKRDGMILAALEEHGL